MCIRTSDVTAPQESVAIAFDCIHHLGYKVSTVLETGFSNPIRLDGKYEFLLLAYGIKQLVDNSLVDRKRGEATKSNRASWFILSIMSRYVFTYHINAAFRLCTIQYAFISKTKGNI